jgi:uncharacterized RDD family membrane protein YckC
MYSGFWKRFCAYLIDSLVLTGAYILFIFIWAGFELFLNAMNVNQAIKELILGILGVPIYISIAWLYFALFESSNLRATLGKMALGIIVVDEEQTRITFLRATARYWSKILSAVILFIGFIMAGFTPKKQALHDIVSKTYLVNKKYTYKENDNIQYTGKIIDSRMK